MKTILEVIHLSAQFLEKNGVASPRREAEDLIAAALKMKRIDLYLKHDCPLLPEELERCRNFLKRRGEREPFSYISGEMEFGGCSLLTTPAALIPRQETELLFYEIAKEIEKSGQLETKTLWDLCCGSGCLGLAIKKQFPKLAVFLSDISPEAIALARENAKKNKLEIEWHLGDLLTPFEGKKAHYVVCNPPYVSEREWHALEPEVRQYEPRLALVAEEEGLHYYARLAEELPAYLHSSAKVWMEIGELQGEAIRRIFNRPCWSAPRLQQDLAGKDRFFSIEYQ